MRKILASLFLCFCLSLVTCHWSLLFGQGTAGPSAANSANYANFQVAFAQPSVSWAATGMTLSYTAGYVANYSSTSVQAITAGTLTLASATEYVYWSSGGSLSHTSTQGTALAASPLYTCTTSGGNITGCVAMSSAVPTTGTVTVNGAMMFQADCVGAIITAETDFIFPFGGNALACAGVTSATSGLVMSSAGTLQNLYVAAGTAGHGANSGAVAILKNGSAFSPSITCKVGTGSTCHDTTDTGTVAAGDVITVSLTGIASETVADVHVSFEKR